MHPVRCARVNSDSAPAKGHGTDQRGQGHPGAPEVLGRSWKWMERKYGEHMRTPSQEIIRINVFFDIYVHSI